MLEALRKLTANYTEAEYEAWLETASETVGTLETGKEARTMTKADFIKKVEELDEILLTETLDYSLCDYARAQAHYSLESVIEYLEENYDPEDNY